MYTHNTYIYTHTYVYIYIYVYTHDNCLRSIPSINRLLLISWCVLLLLVLALLIYEGVHPVEDLLADLLVVPRDDSEHGHDLRSDRALTAINNNSY